MLDAIATSEDKTTPFNLFNIPMTGIEEPDELDDYLLQPIEKVHDPILCWWDHHSVYPKLSQMAFDYLSIPGVYSHEFLPFC